MNASRPLLSSPIHRDLSDSDDDADRGQEREKDPNAVVPTLSHVHRTAFRSRTKALRDDFLATRLSAEDEYNESLYELCNEYQRKFVGDYRSYKRVLAEEEFLAEDWAALSLRQRASVIFHRPMLTGAGRAVAVFSTIVALGSTVALMLETMPQFRGRVGSNVTPMSPRVTPCHTMSHRGG